MKTYKSKFGYTVFIFTCVVCLYPIFRAYKEDKALMEHPQPLGILLFCILLVLYLNLDTQYIIQGSQLRVRCGFFYQRLFDIQTFTYIRRTNSLISSPAPSLKRLEIGYGQFGSLIISPENEKEFAAELYRINSNMENTV